MALGASMCLGPFKTPELIVYIELSWRGYIPGTLLPSFLDVVPFSFLSGSFLKGTLAFSVYVSF